MLKSFVGVLDSQTKLYRVKQERERGSWGYFNKRYVFLKWFVFRLQRTLTCCTLCVPSFVDSKVQLWYLGSPKYRCTSVVSVVILFIGIETFPCNKSFLPSRQSTTTIESVTTLHHFERWCSVCVFMGPDWHTQKVAITGLGNSQKNMMKLAL